MLSRVWLFETPWTVALQAPLSMRFPRQEDWSGLPFPPPGNLPDPGIKPVSLVPPALAGGLFTTEPPGKPLPVYNELFCQERGFFVVVVYFLFSVTQENHSSTPVLDTGTVLPCCPALFIHPFRKCLKNNRALWWQRHFILSSVFHLAALSFFSLIAIS